MSAPSAALPPPPTDDFLEIAAEHSWWNAEPRPDLARLSLGLERNRQLKRCFSELRPANPYQPPASLRQLAQARSLRILRHAPEPIREAVLGPEQGPPKRPRPGAGTVAGEPDLAAERRLLGLPDAGIDRLKPETRLQHLRLVSDVRAAARRFPDVLAERPAVLRPGLEPPEPPYMPGQSFLAADVLGSDVAAATARNPHGAPELDLQAILESEAAEVDEWRPLSRPSAHWFRKLYKTPEVSSNGAGETADNCENSAAAQPSPLGSAAAALAAVRAPGRQGSAGVSASAVASAAAPSVAAEFPRYRMSPPEALAALVQEFRELGLNLEGYIRALAVYPEATVRQVLPILQRNQNLSNRAVEALATVMFSDAAAYHAQPGVTSFRRFSQKCPFDPLADPDFAGQEDPKAALIAQQDLERWREECVRREAELAQLRGSVQEQRRSLLARVLEVAGLQRSRREEQRQAALGLAQACQREVEQIQRRRDIAEQRNRRARMKALQSNDIAAYQELMAEHKNSRLGKLLAETEGFLQQLGEKMRMLQESSSQARAAAGEAATASPSAAPASSSDLAAPAAATTSADLTSRAHLIREPITRQPSLLANGCQLRDYQLQGLEWMVSLYNNGLNGILADEMGLGKTVQTVSLVAYLMEHKANPGPYLVIVPLSTLSNWSQEFQRFAPEIRVVSYIGHKSHRSLLKQQLRADAREGGPPNFNVLITSYEYISNRHDRGTLANFQWQYIIVDEGHRLKNRQSLLARTLNEMYSSRYRLVLTGTPLQNNLNELWNLLNFLLPSIFNSTEDFDSWFNKPFRNAGLASSNSNSSGSGGGGNQDDDAGGELLEEEERLLIINRLHQVLRPFLLRRLKVDVATQLPEKVEVVLKCRISAWQRLLYQQLVDKAITARDPRTGQLRPKVMSNIGMHLRKACNHPYLFLEGEAAFDPDDESTPVTDEIVRSSGKFDLLDLMLPKLLAAGHRTLIFSQMTRVLDILGRYLKWRGLAFLRLDGSTPQADRERMIADFQAPNSPYNLFLLSTRAGGLGLNLQSADTVVLFDSDWNPQADLQAQDRAHRIGQRNEVRVFRLCTLTPMESKMLEIAKFKLAVDAQVIGAGQFKSAGAGAPSSEAERRKALQEVIRAGVDLGQELEAPSPAELNRMMARNPAELELYDRMDREREAQEEAEWRAQQQARAGAGVHAAASAAGAKKRLQRKGGAARGKASASAEEPDPLEYRPRPRLMTEDEVPEEARGVFRDEQGQIQEVQRNLWDVFDEADSGKPADGLAPALEQYGRGRRERRQQGFVEHLSESLMIRAVEAGLDYNTLLAELAARRRKMAEEAAAKRLAETQSPSKGGRGSRRGSPGAAGRRATPARKAGRQSKGSRRKRRSSGGRRRSRGGDDSDSDSGGSSGSQESDAEDGDSEIEAVEVGDVEISDQKLARMIIREHELRNRQEDQAEAAAAMEDSDLSSDEEDEDSDPAAEHSQDEDVIMWD